MSKTIQIKRGPRATMPVLAQGELGMTTDSGAEGLFIGNGTENIEFARKSDLNFKPVGKSYLTFSSPSSFTLAVGDATKHWNGTLEYFASDKTWTIWDGTTALSSIDNDGEHILYLRGTGNTVITGKNLDYRWVLTGSNISCNGNIENLLDYATVESGAHPTMGDYCYYNMFRGCTGLTQAPSLPATTLSIYCYYGMFYGCTSLTQAPALPSTTLANYCYYSMFRDCTGLTQAPTLPATTLVDHCYYSMFCGCTSLTQVPALPATTLAEYCYYGIFRDCTSLTQTPSLPATTLSSSCYYNMFRGCTSLTQAPALSATTLADHCYYSMFLGCTSLTQAPSLPATTLAEYCYNGMFYGCISLAQAPTLPATTLVDYCYYNMFYGCTSLKLSSTQSDEYTQEYSIPSSGTGTNAANALAGMFSSTGGTFTGAPEINTKYYLSSDNMIVLGTEIATLNGYVGSMIDAARFEPDGKSYLTFSSPNNFTLKVNDTTKHWDGTLEYFASNKTWAVWDGTTTLSAVDNDGEYIMCLRGTGNTRITGANSNYKWVLTGSDIACIGNIENLLDYTTVSSGKHPTMAVYCYAYMFRDCTSLIQAPTLSATTLTNGCYYSMFYGCTSLTQVPALPATTLTNACYQDMFYGCTSLTKAPALPATTLAENCYRRMFYGCTSLIQAPALPATTLANYCYYNMFRGCTGLTQAPSLPATTLANYCYCSMFYGCTGLIQVPSLPATTLVNYCYSNMFQGCTSLIHAPSLPAATLADHCYNSMFYGCTSLIQASSLPATTLAKNCYYSMFYGCTSLAQIPALPATTLAENCYNSMFYGCSSLKLSSTQTGEYTQEYRIPTSSTGTTATNALNYMFTSTGGTFTGTPVINTTYYLSSDNMVVRETEIATLKGYVQSMNDAATPKFVSVTLSSASWDSTAKTQTATVTGVLDDETKQLITPTPALASQAAYYEAGILCIGQAADSLTFTCTTVPSADLTVYVVIQEVVYG